MRALLKTSAAPGAEVHDVPVPEPGPGEILVRVEAASVCGTDVHIQRWDPWAAENFGPPPMVFGHEMAGTVVAQGPGADSIPLGSLVGAETHLVDWTCYQCRTGRAHVCQNLRILGVHVPGTFAEYAVIPERNAWATEGLTPEVAALQEPMGNAVHAIFVEEIAGLTVAVLGCGPIGLMAIGICRLAGAHSIYATDLNAERRDLALRMGAVEALDEAGVRPALDVLCDVRTPWEAAARTFGPQKGADAAAVRKLERRLERLAQQAPRDPRGVPMTGAAGGLAGGLWAHRDAKLVPGAAFVLEAVDFDAHVRDARFVVTGEGAIDRQTLQGKAAGEVATRCRQSGVACHAVVGRNDLEPFEARILDLETITQATTLAELEAAGRALAER
jgi:threonine dehydrogenase-like Zn-dependent dehydrogenase